MSSFRGIGELSSLRVRLARLVSIGLVSVRAQACAASRRCAWNQGAFSGEFIVSWNVVWKQVDLRCGLDPGSLVLTGRAGGEAAAEACFLLTTTAIGATQIALEQQVLAAALDVRQADPFPEQ